MRAEIKEAFEDLRAEDGPTLKTHSMLILACLDSELKPYVLKRSMFSHRDYITAYFELTDGHMYEISIKPMTKNGTDQ